MFPIFVFSSSNIRSSWLHFKILNTRPVLKHHAKDIYLIIRTRNQHRPQLWFSIWLIKRFFEYFHANPSYKCIIAVAPTKLTEIKLIMAYMHIFKKSTTLKTFYCSLFTLQIILNITPPRNPQRLFKRDDIRACSDNLTRVIIIKPRVTSSSLKIYIPELLRY